MTNRMNQTKQFNAYKTRFEKALLIASGYHVKAELEWGLVTLSRINGPENDYFWNRVLTPLTNYGLNRTFILSELSLSKIDALIALYDVS